MKHLFLKGSKMFLINWDAEEILGTFIINVKTVNTYSSARIKKVSDELWRQGDIWNVYYQFNVKTVFNLIPTHRTHTHHLIQKPTACLIQNMKKLFYFIYQPLDTRCLSYSKPFIRTQQSQNQPT